MDRHLHRGRCLGPATHFGAEVHVVLLFLQACHEVATGQAIFDVSEFNEDSYWSLRQRLADIRRFAAATACPRDAFAQNWEVAQPWSMSNTTEWPVYWDAHSAHIYPPMCSRS